MVYIWKHIFEVTLNLLQAPPTPTVKWVDEWLPKVQSDANLNHCVFIFERPSPTLSEAYK